MLNISFTDDTKPKTRDKGRDGWDVFVGVKAAPPKGLTCKRDRFLFTLVLKLINENECCMSIFLLEKCTAEVVQSVS